ncbi:PadR family transcriptional regulator [Salinicola acroporae]|nr:PadR family transcriptional regulator [Salinicola acroporae]
MPSARKLNAQELSLLLLRLLDTAPAHGSALSDRVEKLSQGFYRPSPGSLYPALYALTEHDRIAQTRAGRRKVYALTDAGRAWLGSHEGEAERVDQRLRRAGRKLSAMRRAYELNMPDEESSTLAQSMLEARMDLKAALHECLDLPPAAQRRIIQSLTQAAAFIRALDTPMAPDDEQDFRHRP